MGAASPTVTPGYKVYVLNLKISTFSTTLLQPLRSLVDDMVAMSSLDLVRNPRLSQWFWLVKVSERLEPNRSQKKQMSYFPWWLCRKAENHPTFWSRCLLVVPVFIALSHGRYPYQNTGNVCRDPKKMRLWIRDTPRCLSKLTAWYSGFVRCGTASRS